MKKLWNAIVKFFVDLFDMEGPKRDEIPKTGPRLLSVQMHDDGFLTWKAEGIDHWKNVKKYGNVNAWIVINGVNVEHIREGYTRQHLNNIYGPERDHGIRGIKKGQKVKVQLKDIDGPEITNAIEVVWKGRDT